MFSSFLLIHFLFLFKFVIIIIILNSAGLGLHITTRKNTLPNYLYTFVNFLFFHSHNFLIFIFFMICHLFIFTYFSIFTSENTSPIILYIVTFIYSFIDFSYLFIVISVGLSPIYAVLHLPICKHIIWLFYSLNSFLIIYHFSTGLGLHSPVCIAHFLLFWTLFL